MGGAKARAMELEERGYGEVTEFFRLIYRHDNKPIQEIKYPSTRHAEGFSYALFFNQSHCVQGLQDLMYPRACRHLS